MSYSEDWISEKEKKRLRAEISKRFEDAAQPIQETVTLTTAERQAKYDQQLREEAIIEADTRRKEQIEAQRRISEARNTLYTSLLTECFMHIFNNSKDYSEDQYDDNVAKAFIVNYIQNEGVTSILTKMKSSSAILSEMAMFIDEACKKCKDDDECSDLEREEKMEKKFSIEPEQKDEFFKNLNNVIDLEDVTQTIQLRVSNSMSEFISNNAAKKAEIEDTIEQIKDKIDGNTSEEVKEAYKARANERINWINESGDMNLFGKLVENLSISAYHNDDARRAFVENGKINMDKIICHVKSLYTVLEMFNTVGLERFTPAKIQEIVESYDMK